MPNLPVDPTPPPALFKQVQDKLFKQPLISAQPDTSATMIPVDADVLFQWWDKLEEGEHKKSIENMLRVSPLWAVKEKRDLLRGLSNDGSTTNVPTEKVHPSVSLLGQTLRGSSSSNPANSAIEHGTAGKQFGQSQSDGEVGMNLTDGALPAEHTDTLYPADSHFNLNSGHSAGCETDKQKAVALNNGLGQQTHLKGAELVLSNQAYVTQSHAHEAEPKRTNSTKRPADNRQINTSAKRSLELALSSPENAQVYLGTDVEPLMHNASASEVSPIQPLRRSSRKIKGNANLSAFVVGQNTRKPRGTKLKTDPIKEALVAAELERALDKESLEAEPLSKTEKNNIKLFCGLIAPESPAEDTSQTVVKETQLDQHPDAADGAGSTTDLMVEDEDMGDKFSGLDDWNSDEYTDLEDEGDTNADA